MWEVAGTVACVTMYRGPCDIRHHVVAISCSMQEGEAGAAVRGVCQCNAKEVGAEQSRAMRATVSDYAHEAMACDHSESRQSCL